MKITCEINARGSMMKKTLTTSLFAGLGFMLVVPGAWAQDVKANPIAGEKKAAMCIGCHGIPGYRVAYPHVYHVPMIAGQNAKAIEAALKAYKAGERKHPTMVAIAATLSDADITELAAYYGGAAK